MQAWARAFIDQNTGYRIVRAEELRWGALLAEHTSLILDGVACVSDSQFDTVSAFLQQGGKGWLRFPFGTHDEKGFVRPVPLGRACCK